MKLRFDSMEYVYFDAPTVGAAVKFLVLSDNLAAGVGRAFRGELTVTLRLPTQEEYEATTLPQLVNAAFAKIYQELPEAMLLNAEEWRLLATR